MSDTIILNEQPRPVSVAPVQKGQLKIYKDFQNEKLRIDSEIFLTEAERLRSYEHQIKEMRAMIYNYKSLAVQKHRDLEEEMAKLSIEKEIHQRAIQEAKKGRAADDAKIVTIKRKYLDICKERVGIANTVNTESFKILELEDRKSEAHDLFRWILITFYKEPVSRYYWSNFCDQVFKEDKGHDLKERLGKVSAAEIKEEERVATEALLKNRQKYIDHPELASVKEEVKKLVKLGDLVMSGFQLTRQLANEEKLIEQKQMDTKGKEELAQKCVLKANATKERVDLSEKYIVSLDEIDQSLSRKESIYSMAAAEGHKIIEDLRSSQPKFLRAAETPILIEQKPATTFEPTTKPAETVGEPPRETAQEPTIPTYNTQVEKRDECNCTVF